MSDSPCAQLRDLLAQESGGDAPDDIERAIAAHVAACERCRAEDAVLSALLDRYRHAQARPLGDDIEARLLDCVHDRLRP